MNESYSQTMEDLNFASYRKIMSFIKNDEEEIRKTQKAIKYITFQLLVRSFDHFIPKRNEKIIEEDYDILEIEDEYEHNASHMQNCYIDYKPDVRKGIHKMHTYLKCNNDSLSIDFRGIFIQLMLQSLVSFSPNIGRIEYFFISEHTASYYRYKILKEKTSDYTLSDVLGGNRKFLSEYKKSLKKDISFEDPDDDETILRTISENILFQCISHLRVMEEMIEMNMMGNMYFGDIKIKMGEYMDTLLYKTHNQQWGLKYIGVRIVFHLFDSTFVNLPADPSVFYTVDPLSGPRISFSHYAGYFIQKFSKYVPDVIKLYSSARLHYWDDLLESTKFLPAASLGLLMAQASYYEFGVYNNVNRYYINLEGTNHDINNGNRKRLYTIEYNRNLYEIVLRKINVMVPKYFEWVLESTVTEELYFRSFLKENEVVYTTSKELMGRIFSLISKYQENFKDGNMMILDSDYINYYINLDMITGSKNENQSSLLSDLIFLSEKYGDKKSVFIPESILNIQETQQLAKELSKGEFNLEKLTHFGDLKKLNNKKCRFCLKNITPKSCESDEVMEKNCTLDPSSPEECDVNTNVAKLSKGDKYWIAGGKQGQIYKGYLCRQCENPKSSDLTDVAIKRFPTESVELECDSREGNMLLCSEYLNELAASLVASHHYDTQKSPHYMKIYSVFKCVDTEEPTRLSSLRTTLFNYNPEYTNYFMVMERIHGTLENIDVLVSLIESKRDELDLPMLGLDAYFHNCIAQVLCIMRTFQEQLEGMHLDFHPGNVFLKLCDGTLFGERRICESKFFRFEFDDGSVFRIPNLGIIVKLGDLGHARIKPVKGSTKLILRQPGHMTKKEKFAKMASDALSAIGLPGSVFTEQFYTSSYMRYHDRYDDTYDIACLFNKLATNKCLFNHPAVNKYHKLEKMFHMGHYGHTKYYYQNKLNCILFFLADYPTAYVPKITASFVTPRILLETDLFQVFVYKPSFIDDELLGEQDIVSQKSSFMFNQKSEDEKRIIKKYKQKNPYGKELVISKKITGKNKRKKIRREKEEL